MNRKDPFENREHQLRANIKRMRNEKRLVTRRPLQIVNQREKKSLRNLQRDGNAISVRNRSEEKERESVRDRLRDRHVKVSNGIKNYTNTRSLLYELSRQKPSGLLVAHAEEQNQANTTSFGLVKKIVNNTTGPSDLKYKLTNELGKYHDKYDAIKLFSGLVPHLNETNPKSQREMKRLSKKRLQIKQDPLVESFKTKFSQFIDWFKLYRYQYIVDHHQHHHHQLQQQQQQQQQRLLEKNNYAIGIQISKTPRNKQEQTGVETGGSVKKNSIIASTLKSKYTRPEYRTNTQKHLEKSYVVSSIVEINPFMCYVNLTKVNGDQQADIRKVILLKVYELQLKVGDSIWWNGMNEGRSLHSMNLGGEVIEVVHKWEVSKQL